MTLVDGVWYDNELNYGYGKHEFILSSNEDGIDIVKCKNCNESRMYLTLMDKTACNPTPKSRKCK